MSLSRRSLMLLAAAAVISACGRKPDRSQASRGDLHPGETPEMRVLIRKYAAVHEIPESLLHRVIQRESDYNAGARNGP